MDGTLGYVELASPDGIQSREIRRTSVEANALIISPKRHRPQLAGCSTLSENCNIHHCEPLPPIRTIGIEITRF
jgi:hypothetical protein